LFVVESFVRAFQIDKDSFGFVRQPRKDSFAVSFAQLGKRKIGGDDGTSFPDRALVEQRIAGLEQRRHRRLVELFNRYGIRGARIAGASGVWIVEEGAAPRKICAIGVRASRFVTMHGFALNVSTDLEWFGLINPCGFVDRGVTSIERETGRTVPMDEVKKSIVTVLSEKLDVKIYNK